MADQAENPRAVTGNNLPDLQKLTDRVLNLMAGRDEVLEEAKTFTADIKEVYGEAKSQGYDVKILRKAVALKRLDGETRDVLGRYVEALDIFA